MPALPALAAFQPNPPAPAGFLVTPSKRSPNYFLRIINHISVGHYEQISDETVCPGQSGIFNVFCGLCHREPSYLP
jgi:hypothetical protein